MFRIGQTFNADLAAAGLDDLPIVIDLVTGKVIDLENKLTPQQRAAAEAVLAAHNPDAGPRVWTPLQFKELFTQEERIAMRQFARTDDIAEDFLDLLNASTEVHADDPRLLAGFSYMVSCGVLSQERVNAVLNS